MENEVLQDEERLSVTVMVNEGCEMGKYSVTVQFGARRVDSDGCNIKQNATNEELLGDVQRSVFSVDAASVILQSNEQYCYNVSLNGMTGIK